MQESCSKEIGLFNAIQQLKRYQEEIPQLFHTNEILIGSESLWCKVWGHPCSGELFHEWKDEGKEKFPNMEDHPSVKEMLELGLIKKEDLSEKPTSQEVLIAGVLNKKNLLDIIQNFIVYELIRRSAERQEGLPLPAVHSR